MSITELLTGELGGMIAFAFGMGCASGWAFATKTTLRGALAQLNEAKKERDEFRKLWMEAVKE